MDYRIACDAHFHGSTFTSHEWTFHGQARSCCSWPGGQESTYLQQPHSRRSHTAVRHTAGAILRTIRDRADGLKALINPLFPSSFPFRFLCEVMRSLHPAGLVRRGQVRNLYHEIFTTNCVLYIKGQPTTEHDEWHNRKATIDRYIHMYIYAYTWRERDIETRQGLDLWFLLCRKDFPFACPRWRQKSWSKRLENVKGLLQSTVRSRVN